jgi:uncharacterized membrane protein
VIAFLLAMAVEILVWAVVDAAPALLVLGVGVGGLFLWRKLRLRSRQAAPGEG